MSFPRGRGRILCIDGQAFVVATCPLCRREHRYGKGDVKGEEIADVRRRGFTDEWLPCQKDLPGNYWRVVIGSGNRGGRTNGRKTQTEAVS
jgi:hypothetical protein